jgi:hypothetical protein
MDFFWPYSPPPVIAGKYTPAIYYYSEEPEMRIM